MSDRPFVIDSRLDFRFLGLTNKLVLVYKKSENGFQYRYVEGQDQFLDTINHTFIMSARDWVVAETEQQLDEIIPMFDSEEYKNGIAKDELEYTPIETLKSGWSIKD